MASEMTLRILGPALFAALVAAAALASPAGEESARPDGPRVEIREPRRGRPVAGRVRLAVEIESESRIVRAVFRVDGEAVGTREQPPWEVD